MFAFEKPVGNNFEVHLLLSAKSNAPYVISFWDTKNESKPTKNLLWPPLIGTGAKLHFGGQN